MKWYLVLGVICALVILGVYICNSPKDKEVDLNVKNNNYTSETKGSKAESSSILVKESEKVVAANSNIISNEFISLEKQMEYAIIRKKYLEKQRLANEKYRENWKINQVRLKKLYLEYSNRWDQIENKHDLLDITDMIEDKDVIQKITENLLDNAKDIDVARSCAVTLAINKEHESQSKELSPEESKKLFQEAIDYYEKFEQRVLGNNKLEDVYPYLSADERKALSHIYHTKGIAYQMVKDGDNCIDCFEKVVVVKQNSELCSKLVAEKLLASAYAIKKDQENVMKWLEKSLETYKKIDNEETRAIYYRSYQKTLEKLELAKKGEFRPSYRYH